MNSFHFTDDFSFPQRQNVRVTRNLLMNNARFKLSACLFEEIPKNQQINNKSIILQRQGHWLYLQGNLFQNKRVFTNEKRRWKSTVKRPKVSFLGNQLLELTEGDGRPWQGHSVRNRFVTEIASYNSHRIHRDVVCRDSLCAAFKKRGTVSQPKHKGKSSKSNNKNCV